MGTPGRAGPVPRGSRGATGHGAVEPRAPTLWQPPGASGSGVGSPFLSGCSPLPCGILGARSPLWGASRVPVGQAQTHSAAGAGLGVCGMPVPWGAPVWVARGGGWVVGKALRAREGHAPQCPPSACSQLEGNETNLGTPKTTLGVTPGVSSPPRPPFDQLWWPAVAAVLWLTTNRCISGCFWQEPVPLPTLRSPPAGSEGARLCRAGPRHPGVLGGHRAHRPLPCLPPAFPSRCQEAAEAAGSAPAAPFPPPVEEQREPGRHSSGSRWASAAACQPCCSQRHRSPPAVHGPPAPAELLAVGAHVPVLGAELAPHGPSPAAAPSSRAWEQLPVSFPPVVCCYCLLLSFPPLPVPSAGSRNQAPSGPDAVCVAARCGSCSPVRGQSGAWISGNVRAASGSPAPLRCSLIPEQHQVLFCEAPSRA
ncbi:transcription initiation factor TFIID subunit 4-like [Lathamus discolor]|uniref:transcription initiation factor TFIID subunit 4-like n=1 Tax=Lathamus discolor TaxID=678569 RepID=UPI0032B71A9E